MVVVDLKMGDFLLPEMTLLKGGVFTSYGFSSYYDINPPGNYLVEEMTKLTQS